MERMKEMKQMAKKIFNVFTMGQKRAVPMLALYYFALSFGLLFGVTDHSSFGYDVAVMANFAVCVFVMARVEFSETEEERRMFDEE